MERKQIAMGNEQSGTDHMKSRRSLDANFLRQVNSAQSTPRTSTAVPHLEHKFSESALNVSPCPTKRLSSDCPELKYYKPKLSLSALPDMGNQQGRRLSRAAVQMENGETGSTLADSLKLTQYQIQLLQSTWSKLKSTSTFTQVFKLLCFKSTQSREMFQKMSIVEGFRTNQCCDLNMHAKVLCDLFDSIVSDLQQSSKIVQARCMDIGGSHVNISEKSCGPLWDQLGECLTEVITKMECVRSKRESAKAWITLISYVVDGMKCGYMDEWKRKASGRLTSNGCPNPKLSETHESR
ncbi:unnamed protein product [Cylicocyclus nassatus]|uniref:Uncharacterized protein n=1 Tax=Cylicocyclus nassatus TaxID=53992 RepID=A0AA36GJY6_CYLNA|nr:unnamed protein product [Cylicocyclus nassatus]